jgi:predicted lipid-binding transport protein (Tim44 family)
MISLGVLLVILGVGSLVLPYLDLQFALMDFVDPYQPWAGVIVAAIGLITILFAAQRRGRKEMVVEPAHAAPAKAETAPTAPAQPAAAESPPAPTPTEAAWPTEPPERSDD